VAGGIDHLIINSPYEEPSRHWSYNRDKRQFHKAEGRRPAGYVIASSHSKSFDDPGIFVELPLVNQIRKRVKEWRQRGYPGVTGITKKLELAPIVDGKPDVTKLTQIDLEELGKRYRKQRIIFEATRDIYEQMKPNWQGNKEYLLFQLIKLVEEFIDSDKIWIPSLFDRDEFRSRLLITLNMNKVVHHIFEAIRFDNAQHIEPVFDKERPIRSTGDMMTWYTSKPCEITRKSHISHVVFDSTWEASEAFELERNELVDSWVKNDHLGFEILYIYKGVVRKYRPDFLIRLSNGKMLVLEVKGQDNQQNKAKQEALDLWVKAVNAHGGFGEWCWDISYRISDLKDILLKRGCLITVDGGFHNGRIQI